MFLLKPCIGKPKQLTHPCAPRAKKKRRTLASIFNIETGLQLLYTSTGSGKGKCRLEDFWLDCNTTNPSTDNTPPFVVDWAGTDSIFTSTDYAHYPDLQLYPAIAAAVVAIYNLPGGPDLVLTPVVLAAIFRQCIPGATCLPGWIYSWSDPAILALNTDPAVQAILQAAGNITLVVRADNSGTTEIFKNALNIVDPSGFGAQVYANNGPSGAQSAVWYNVQVIHGNTNNGVVAHVLAVPGALGYTSLDVARSATGLKYAGGGPSILATDGILRATTQSVSFALVEKGFEFGNNGVDNASRLTATISGAQGSEAWPLVGYSYFAVRKNTLRPNATCADRDSTLQWIQWFYTSDAAQSAIPAQGFGALPVELRTVLVNDVRASFLCDGVLVSNSVGTTSQSTVSSTAVSVYALAGNVQSAMQVYGESFDAANGKTLTTVTTYDVTAVNWTGANAPAPLSVYVLDRTSALALPQQSPMTAMPAAAAAWGVVYNLCNSTLSTSCTADLGSIVLVLDTQLLLDILSGVVTMWDDDRIKTRTVNADYLPSQPIVVIGYTSTAPALQKLQAVFAQRTGVTPTFQVAQAWALDQTEAALLVGGVRYSMTVAPINVGQDTSISRVASMLDASGTVVVAGDANALAACVTTPGSVDLTTSYLLATSTQTGCWPLAEAYFFLTPSAPSDADCQQGQAQAAVQFISLVLNLDTTPFSTQGIAPLDQPTARALLANVQCFGRSISALVVDQSFIPLGLVYFSWVFAIAIVLMCTWLGLWIYYHRHVMLINASSPAFLLQMALGCALEILSIVPMGMQENVVPTHLLNYACMAYPWLFISGFALVYAPLLVKTFRIYRLFNNRKLVRLHITNTDLLKMEAVGAVPIVVLLVFWTLYDPLVWTRAAIGTDSISGAVVVTAGTCTAHNLTPTLVPIVVLLGCGLLAGVYLAWLNRNAPTEFSEGRYVSMNIVMLAEALTLGVPIIILSSSNPLSSFLVKMLIVAVTVSLTLVIFFLPKVAVVKGWWSLEDSSQSFLLSAPPKQDSEKRVFGGSVRLDNPVGHFGNAQPSARRSPKGSFGLHGHASRDSSFRFGQNSESASEHAASSAAPTRTPSPQPSGRGFATNPLTDVIEVSSANGDFIIVRKASGDARGSKDSVSNSKSDPTA